MEILKCDKREKYTSHESRKERRAGKIPGILYGKGIVNYMFEVSELELNKEISINGEHGIIDMNLEGTNHKALIKEIQRDPVDHKIIHIDVEELKEDSKVTTEIPIVFMGENEVKKDGGIIQKEKSSIKVQCSASEIPRYINVDLSNLHLGDTYRVSDIELSKEIAVIDDLNTPIVTITGTNTVDIAPTNSIKVEENFLEADPEEKPLQSWYLLLYF